MTSPHEQFQLALRALNHGFDQNNLDNNIPSESWREASRPNNTGGGKIFQALQMMSHQTVQTSAPIPISCSPRNQSSSIDNRVLARRAAAPMAKQPATNKSTSTGSALAASASSSTQVSKQAANTKSCFNTSKHRGVTRHRHTGNGDNCRKGTLRIHHNISSSDYDVWMMTCG